MLDVALVTCTRIAAGDDDDFLLVDALRRLGLSSEFVCWDDPDARWPVAGMALIRSTWDYHERVGAFLDWAAYVSSVTRLRNHEPTIRWNSQKRYLLDLEDAGVGVVPTRVVRAGEKATLGSGAFVVKPAVSIGADRTTRFAAQADLDELTATDDALIQPYMAEIETSGELSIVCIEGEPAHVVRKVPAAGDFRSQEHLGATATAIELEDSHRELARRALATVSDVPLYARVDAVDTTDGLRLMELELIEPTLWLRWHPPTADVLARAIADQLTRSP